MFRNCGVLKHHRATPKFGLYDQPERATSLQSLFMWKINENTLYSYYFENDRQLTTFAELNICLSVILNSYLPLFMEL